MGNFQTKKFLHSRREKWNCEEQRDMPPIKKVLTLHARRWYLLKPRARISLPRTPRPQKRSGVFP
jgi:hypothetical protein